MIRLVSLALALAIFAATPAQAGVAGGLIAGLSAAFKTVMASTLAGTLIRTGLSIGFSLLSQRLRQKGARGGGIETSATTSGGTDPQGTVLGWAATGGHVVYRNSHGSNNRYLTHVIEVSDLKGCTLDGLIINGEECEFGEVEHADFGLPITTFSDEETHREVVGYNEGTDRDIYGEVTRTRDYAWIRFYDGSQTGADAQLIETYGDDEDRPWSADHIGTGVCYAVLTFDYNTEVFTSVPTVRFVLNGIPVYDPRLDSSVGGLGDQRWSSPETWATSTNPIVLAYNIHRGLTLPCGSVWGGGTAFEDLPLDNWVAAMNACDEEVGDPARPRYRAGLELRFEEGVEPADVLEELYAAANTQVAELGGVFRVQVAAPASPLIQISDDDLIVTQPQDFEPFPGLETTYNAVAITHLSPEDLWNSKELDPITNADWEMEDGRRRTASLQLPAVPWAEQALQLGNDMLRDERRFRRHGNSLPPEFFWLEPLMTLGWTSPWNSYEAKLFEVSEAVYDLRTMVVTLSLRERDPEDFTFTDALELPSPPAALTPPARRDAGVPGFAVTGVAISDGAALRRPALRLSWNAAMILDTVEGVAFEVRRAGSTEVLYPAPVSYIRQGETIFDAVLPATAYEARAGALSSVRRTLWTDWFPATTPDLRFTQADLADDLNARVDEAFARHDATLEEASGTIAALRDAVIESFGELQQIDGLPLIEAITTHIAPLAPIGGLPLVEAIESALGPLEAPVSLSTRIDSERQRLDLAMPRIYSAEDAVDDIWQRLVDLSAAQFATDQRLVDAGVYVSPEDGTVRLFALEALETQVTDVRVELDAVQGQLSLAASQAWVEGAISDALLDPTQIPVIDGLEVRMTTLEVTLDTESARIDLLSDTLTVSGGLVTMASVTASLDSLEGELALRATQAELDGVEARIGAAEVVIAALPESASISQSVEAARTLAGELDDLTEASIADRWAQFEGDRAVTVAQAQATSDLRAYVDERGAAAAEEVTSLSASVGASFAQIEQTLQVRAEASEVITESVEQLQADLASAEGDLVAQADALDAVTARVSETETGLSAESGRRQVLAASVAELEIDQVEGLEASIGALWESWQADADLRAGVAVLMQDQRAYVDEGLVAEARAREVLGAALGEAQASLAQETRARATADEAQAEQISDLQAGLGDAEDGISANAAATTALTTRVTSTEGQLSAQAQALTELEVGLTDAEGEIAANASATNALSARVGETEAGLVAESQRREVLTASVSGVETDLDVGLEASIGAIWEGWAADEDIRRGVAVQLLDQRSYVEEGLIAEASARSLLGAALDDAQATLRQEAITRAAVDAAQAQQITDLQAVLTDPETGIVIDAQALNALTTRVSVAEGEISAQAEDLTTLQSSLEGVEGDIAANALATTNLTTRVTEAEGEIDSQSQAITTLESSLEDAEGNIAANALATTNLTTRVTEAEGDIDSQSQAITTLESSLEDAEGDIAANALATTNLTTRVAEAEGEIDSQSQAITTLESSLEDAEGDIAANALATTNLTTRVTEAEGEIDSQSQAITTLESSLEDAEGDIAANALATTNLTTRVSEAEGDIDTQAMAITDLQTALSVTKDGTAANAGAITGLTTRVEDNEDGLSAQAGRLDVLEASIDTPITGISARLETVETAYVDEAGAIASTETQIAANYGSLSAMASATAYAEAQADGISAGFVLRLNGQGVFEAVSVSDGTGGATTTALLGADYVRITGLTQIEQAVINDLAVNSGFIGNLTVGNAQIAGALSSDNYAEDANGRPTAGWALNKDTGALKLAGPVISRQLEIAAGSFAPGVLTVNDSDGLKLRQSWDLIPTGIAMPVNQVWMPSERTFLAYAAFNGTAEAEGAISGNDEYWGCIATLQPFARWNGPQQLYLRIELWSQGVTKLYSNADPTVSGTIHWKLYEVS